MSALIFSVNFDFHASAVCWALNAGGVSANIFDVTSFPSNNHFSIFPFNEINDVFNFGKNGNVTDLDFEVVKVVWSRRMLHSAQYFDFSKVHELDLSNVVSETGSYIKGLWYFFEEFLSKEVKWVNSLDSLSRASSKALQLRVAQSVGFKVPNTIIGNNPFFIRKFCQDQGGEIIMKPFFQQAWKNGDVFLRQPTTLIDLEKLKDDDPISLCPAIFQNRIKKRFEIRVLVMGDEIISAKINSQEYSHSSLDWRLDAYKRVVKIEPYCISESVHEKIIKFMRKIGLRFGSIDLIVDDVGDIVFLEVNEQGNFLFLEKQCPELPVLRSVCNFFASEAGLVNRFDFPSLNDFLGSSELLKINDLFNESENLNKQKVDHAFVY